MTSQGPSGSYDPNSLVGDAIADRYVVRRVVSTGSSTALFDAVDQQSGRMVTVKLLRPRLAASPLFRERFTEQMSAAATLSHPNIAAIFDHGIAPVGNASTAFVVIEHLTGGSLRDMFDRGRRLSPSQALAVGLDTCRALDYAHRRGFVHSELNPSKIIFGGDRRLRIVDFGLAKLLGDTVWEQREQVPTHVAWYAAPEQAQGLSIDGKADVYALCLTLGEAITGELPFKSDSTVNTLANRVGKLMPVSADMGPLAALLERAGRPEPDERSTASELGKALVQAAGKLPRPEPLPLLSVGLFDTPTEQMRRPDDPTGGVHRPADADAPTEPLVVVPVDHEVGQTAPQPEPAAAQSATLAQRSGIVGLDDDDDSADMPGDVVVVPLDAAIGDRPRPPMAGPEPTASATATVPTATSPVAGAGQQSSPTATMPAYVEPPKRRGRTAIKILFGLILVGAFVGLGIAATKLFSTTTYVVPELTGVPEAEARNLISTNGWVISTDSERSDEVPEIGSVVRTSPEPGVELAEGEPFQLVISQGPTLRDLPDVTGLPLAEAQSALVDRGLLVTVAEQYHEEVPPQSVIGWSVPGDPTLVAGAQVLPDTSVELVISLGPEPRPVPNLIQLPIDAANAALEERQLVLQVTGEEFSEDVPAGQIITQAIPEGEPVERGATVGVVVSKGPDLVIFPDLSAAPDFATAKRLLEESGFTAELVLGASDGTDITYKIDGETPEVGGQFPRGTKVDITVL